MTAKVEEIVASADPLDAEHLTPHLRDQFLGRGPRSLPGAVGGSGGAAVQRSRRRRLAQLRQQSLQVLRRHHHLRRRASGQDAFQHVGALRRSNALV